MFRTGFKAFLGLHSLPRWLRALAFGLAYFLSAVVGSHLSQPGSSYVSFWLPSGLYVAVLLLNERRDWGALALGVLPANLGFDLLHGTVWWLGLLFYVANTLQAVLGAWLVQRLVVHRPALSTVKEFVGLLTLAGILATLPGAIIGAGGLYAAGLTESFLQSAKVWWGSCALAVLLFSPLVLVWCDFLAARRTDLERGPVRPRRMVEGAVLFGGLILSTWYVFVLSEGVTTPYKYRTLPLLLWAGLRFGRRGAATANFIYAALVVYSVGHAQVAPGTGLLVPGEVVFMVQTYLVVSALVGLIPAITLAERDVTLAKLRESEAHYRNLTDAAFEGVCISEEGRILDVNDQFLAMFGASREQIIGSQIMDLVAPESLELVAAAVRSGRESIYGHRLKRQDGSFFQGEARAKMVRMEGRTLRMTALRDITERIESEEALRLSEEKFSKAFLSSPSAILITRQSDGTIVETNETFCRWFGIAPEKSRGRNVLELGVWNSTSEREAVIRQLRQAGAIRNLEKEVLPAGGRMVLLISVEQITIQGEECLLTVGQDITVLKQAERALQENEAKFRTLFNTANDAIFIMDGQLILDCNQRTESMFGCTRGEIVGHSPVEFSPERQFDDLPSADKSVQKITAVLAGEPQFFEWNHRRPNGTLFDAEVSLNRVELGGRFYLQAIVRDITARKQGEQDLRENQRMLTTLMANLPGLVYRCQNDSDWTMEFVSEGCYALTGYRPEDLVRNRTTSFGALIQRDDQERVAQTVRTTLQRRGVFELTYRIHTASGQEKWVWERGQGVWSPEGSLLALEGFITDVTAQHKAEAEREAATKREQEARNGFTRQLIDSQEAERTRIAREIHDHLGQLLTALKLDLRSLERRTSVLSDIDLRTALANKITSAKELADETITSVQKIASELRPGILDRLGLAAAIEVEAQTFESRTGVRCLCAVPHATVEIPPDRAMAAFRIFQEIITNVARHAHATEVGIQLVLNCGLLELTVADNGVGLQGNPLTHPKSLGLLGMKERAEILGGQIEFRKPETGSGTVVAVRLPLGSAS